MTESAKKSKVNALSLKKAMAKDMAIVGDKLADTVLSGSTARAEQEAGRVAVVDMVASLEKGLAPGFTKEGLLYKDFPASDLGAVVTDAFCNMVDIVRRLVTTDMPRYARRERFLLTVRTTWARMRIRPFGKSAVPFRTSLCLSPPSPRRFGITLGVPVQSG